MSQIALLAIVTAAGIIDWRTTKIFNWLTFPAALLGLAINAITGGWQGALMAVAGMVLALVVMMVPDYVIMKRPKQGLGDVKLMAAIGAFQGPVGMLITFFYYSLLYGAVAIYKVGPILFRVLKSNNPDDIVKYNESKQKKMPLGPWIAVGTALSIFLREPTLSILGIPKTVGDMPVILAMLGF